jgi:hypothetical protein
MSSSTAISGAGQSSHRVNMLPWGPQNERENARALLSDPLVQAMIYRRGRCRRERECRNEPH